MYLNFPVFYETKLLLLSCDEKARKNYLIVRKLSGGIRKPIFDKKFSFNGYLNLKQFKVYNSLLISCLKT